MKKLIDLPWNIEIITSNTGDREQVRGDTLAEVLLGLERLLAVPQTEQMPLVYVQLHDLLKQLIQRLRALASPQLAF